MSSFKTDSFDCEYTDFHTMLLVEACLSQAQKKAVFYENQYRHRQFVKKE
jgi:hypothetical protein